MLKKGLTIVFVFFISAIYSQIDSVESMILKYDNSKSIIISKGRRLLLDKFNEHDILKVKEIQDYLMEKVEDDDYIALFPVENWFVMYWTEEYEALSNTLAKFDSLFIAESQGKIRPQEDMLFKKLLEKSIDSCEYLKSQILSSTINQEEKEFLTLNLDYLIADLSYESLEQDILNQKSEAFLSSYPKSEYGDFTKGTIYYKLKPKDWGFAVEFFSGYGIYTGELSSKYTNNVPIGVAFDICYKKLELYLRDYIGFNKTKEDLIYSTGVYEKGSGTTVFLPEASLGYVILDNNRIKLSPFAGIGSMDISSPSAKTIEIPELKEINLEFTTTYMLGFNFDIKFGKKEIAKYKPKSSYGFMRLRYAYNFPTFERKYENATGNMHYITIGFGGMARGDERAYK